MTDKSAREYTSALIEGYNKWFWDQGIAYERRLTRFFWAGIIFSFLATITAAFPTSLLANEMPKLNGVLGWLVVVFTTLATLFNATLVPRYKSLLQLRDTGRIRLDELKQMHEISEYNLEDRSRLEEIIKRIAVIEADFGGSDRPGSEGTKGSS